MSIDAVAAELRQAVARLPLDLLVQAATLFDEARTLLAAASQGTNRPEAPAAIQALDTAIAQVAQMHQTATEVQRLTEQYIAHIAGGERTNSATLAPRPPSAPGLRPAVDQELVAELVRQGKKITPEKVVRIGRDKAGKAVWMEEGTERSGVGPPDGPRTCDRLRQQGRGEAGHR